mgnify:CR=1 FL=1
MENLNDKVWYRLLKVVFIITFILAQLSFLIIIIDASGYYSTSKDVVLQIALGFLIISAVFWLVSRIFSYIFLKEKFLSGRMINEIKIATPWGQGGIMSWLGLIPIGFLLWYFFFGGIVSLAGILLFALGVVDAIRRLFSRQRGEAASWQTSFAIISIAVMLFTILWTILT